MDRPLKLQPFILPVVDALILTVAIVQKPQNSGVFAFREKPLAIFTR